MGNLEIATIFIVVLNVLMWFCSTAMIDINPTGNVCFTLGGSVIENSITTSGNYSTLDNDVISDLPSASGSSISAGYSGGSIFTDIFNNILNWFKSAPGLKYVYGVVSAPYNILKCLNLPSVFVVGIGTLWYLVSLLTLAAFLWGR